MVLHDIEEHIPIRAVEEDVKIMIDSQVQNTRSHSCTRYLNLKCDLIKRDFAYPDIGHVCVGLRLCILLHL
jgi:hypothetical protein